MKPAAIRYVTLLGIFLLASAMAWTSLLEARGPNVSTSRLMSSARLFEQQGRVLKAAELYRQVLRVAPDHKMAAYRLAGLRANAAAVLRSTEPKVATPAATITPVEAVKPVAVPQPVKPVAVVTKQESKSIPARISDAVNKLKPKWRKLTNHDADTGSNQDVQDEATGSKEPKQVLVKTKKASATAGSKVRRVIPRRRVVQVETTKPVQAVTPDKTAKPVEVVTPKAVVPAAVPRTKSKSIRTRISNAVSKLKPRLKKTISRDVASGEKQEADDESTNPKESKPVLPKTRKALTEVGNKFRSLVPKSLVDRSGTAKLAEDGAPVQKVTPADTAREKDASQAKTTSDPQVIPNGGATVRIAESEVSAEPRKTATNIKKTDTAGTPLWTRVNAALKRSRENLAEKLGIKSKAKAVQPEAATAPVETPLKPVKPKTDVKKAKPVVSSRPAEIPQLTTSERIASASKMLMKNPDDEPARRVLVEAVALAPDVEASLAAYMLGTRGSGHQDVMTALGEQLTVRTGVARVHMGEAMLRLDGNHVTATDALVGLVSSTEPQIRMMAAFAMQSATAAQRDRCISTLIKVLRDKDSDVRATAALALGGYGPNAKAALPAIVRLVHDENVDTARAAGVALQCIAPPPATAEAKTTIRPVTAEAVIEQ